MARIPTQQAEQKELRAVIVSLIFLFFGLGVIWVAGSVLQVKGESVIVSLLLIPVLVYIIVSGRLKELKGPGGLEARFAEAAVQPPVYGGQSVEPSQGIQIVQKQGLRALRTRLGELDESRPIIMTLDLGKGNYDRVALAGYVTLLSQFRSFKFVVFLDSEGRFRGYMPSWVFKGVLTLPDFADEFIGIINEGRLQDLYKYQGVVGETISTHSTNADALKEMLKQHLEALVVIDDGHRLKGIVERDQLLSRMMLALVD